MNRVIDWKNIVEESNGIKERKKDVRLFLDCVYKNKTYAQNYSNDIITVMFPEIGNQGGFRPCDARNGAIPKYVVIYSTGKDIYWPDELDEELGLYTYYGDNKVPGSDLLELLYRFEQVNNCDSLNLYLKPNYPKDRKDGEII